MLLYYLCATYLILTLPTKKHLCSLQIKRLPVLAYESSCLSQQRAILSSLRAHRHHNSAGWTLSGQFYTDFIPVLVPFVCILVCILVLPVQNSVLKHPTACCEGVCSGSRETASCVDRETDHQAAKSRAGLVETIDRAKEAANTPAGRIRLHLSGKFFLHSL